MAERKKKKTTKTTTTQNAQTKTSGGGTLDNYSGQGMMWNPIEGKGSITQNFPVEEDSATKQKKAQEERNKAIEKAVEQGKNKDKGQAEADTIQREIEAKAKEAQEEIRKEEPKASKSTQDTTSSARVQATTNIPKPKKKESTPLPKQAPIKSEAKSEPSAPKPPKLDEPQIETPEVDVEEQDFSGLDSSVPRVKEMKQDLSRQNDIATPEKVDSSDRSELAPKQETQPEGELYDYDRPIENLSPIKDTKMREIILPPKAPELSDEVEVPEEEIEIEEEDFSNLENPTPRTKEIKQDLSVASAPASSASTAPNTTLTPRSAQKPSESDIPTYPDEVPIPKRVDIQTPSQVQSASTGGGNGLAPRSESSIPSGSGSGELAYESRVAAVNPDKALRGNLGVKGQGAKPKLAPKISVPSQYDLPDYDDEDEIEIEEEMAEDWALNPKNQPSPNQGKTLSAPAQAEVKTQGLPSPAEITAPIKPKLNEDIQIEDTPVEVESVEIQDTEVPQVEKLTAPKPKKIRANTIYGGKSQVITYDDGSKETLTPKQGEYVIWDDKTKRFVRKKDGRNIGFLDREEISRSVNEAINESGQNLRENNNTMSKQLKAVKDKDGNVTYVEVPEGEEKKDVILSPSDRTRAEVERLNKEAKNTPTTPKAPTLPDDVEIKESEITPEEVEIKDTEVVVPELKNTPKEQTSETPEPPKAPALPDLEDKDLEVEDIEPEVKEFEGGETITVKPLGRQSETPLTPEDELVRATQEANQKKLEAFDTYVKSIGASHDAEKAEMAAQEKANSRAAMLTGLGEIGAGIINMLGVGENHAVSQRYHSFSQDWMNQAEQDIRDHRKRRANMTEAMERLKFQKAQLEADSLRDLADIKYKAAEAKDAKRRQAIADQISKIKASKEGIIIGDDGIVTYDPTKDEPMIIQWIDLNKRGVFKDANGKITYDPTKDIPYQEHLKQMEEHEEDRQWQAKERALNWAISMAKLSEGGFSYDEKTGKVTKDPNYVPPKDDKVTGYNAPITFGGQPITLVYKDKRSYDDAVRSGVPYLKESLLAQTNYTKWEDLIAATTDRSKKKAFSKEMLETIAALADPAAEGSMDRIRQYISDNSESIDAFNRFLIRASDRIRGEQGADPEKKKEDDIFAEVNS